MAKKVEAFFIVPSVLANQNIKYVAIYVDLTNPSGTSAASFAQKIVAILDTGANISVIDAELINTGRLQKVGENAAVAAGVRRVVERYRCQIIIKELEYFTDLDVASSPLKANNRNYHVILGMDILQNFDLNITANFKEALLSRPT